jgi:hypothetical protein
MLHTLKAKDFTFGFESPLHCSLTHCTGPNIRNKKAKQTTFHSCLCCYHNYLNNSLLIV